MENKEECKIISKELTWKGLRMELPEEELQAIFQQEYELDKYYDFDLLIKGLYKALNKEIDFEYFKDWCVLIANCFSFTNYENDKVNVLMGSIGYFFDGLSFRDKWNEKDLYSAIAGLKDYNHTFKNKINRKRLPFETNGVERILTFDHANWALDSRVYRVIVKDNNKKEFDLKYVDEANFVYDDKINYTFVGNRTFNNIFDSFYYDYEDKGIKWKENHNLKF